MSKKLLTLVALTLVLSVVLAGCGGGGTSSTATDPGSAADPGAATESGGAESGPAPSTSGPAQQLTLVTGSTGGTYFALGGAMATAWGNNLDNISVSAIASGASVENINLINAGEADLGLSMNSIADAAWKGEDPFPAESQNFRTLGVVYPEVYQLVATSSSGATSLSDLAGMRVAIGPVGSGSAVASEIAFNAAGMDIGSDINAERDGFSDATAKMQDGHLDASAGVLAVPASAIIELETSVDLSFIDISDAELAAIQADYPVYTRFVIPAGTYSNTEDVLTITCQAALYCRADLDEETAYQVTKAFYEAGGEIAAAHAAGMYINLETALDGITTPVHPGAARYYEEMGMTVPAELIID